MKRWLGVGLREQSDDSHLEGRQWPQKTHTSRRLLSCRSPREASKGRSNARCAAVGEASEASRDADVTVTHAHAQRHGCPSARWIQTRHACYKHGTHAKVDEPKVGLSSNHLKRGIMQSVTEGRVFLGCLGASVKNDWRL